MSRTSRLFDLMQILRSHRYPVTAVQLAETLKISVRTLYRDIATLQAHGANIEGEAGLGYILRPGFMLPPLMFTDEEIEALVLGTRWVSTSTDLTLSKAAKDALVKIASVLPVELSQAADSNSLMVFNSDQYEKSTIDVSIIRNAIRTECKLNICYKDLKGDISERTIWPIAIGYFVHVMVVAGWCELRQDYRHFRIDRISDVNMQNQRYPRRRHVLFNEWRAQDSYQSKSCTTSRSETPILS